MIRTLVISILVVAWLAFVYVGKKERLQYVSEALPIAQPDQFVGVQSGKLFFPGFSAAGTTERGSNLRKPSICFRPDPESSPEADRIIITIEANFIAPLVGQTVRAHINETPFDYLVTSGNEHAFEVRRAARVENGLVCVKFDLPITLRTMWNYRGLRMQFAGLTYHYAAQEKPGRDTGSPVARTPV